MNMDNCEIAPKYIDVTDFIVTGIWSYFSASKIIPAGDLPAVVKEIKIGAIDIDIDWDQRDCWPDVIHQRLMLCLEDLRNYLNYVENNIQKDVKYFARLEIETLNVNQKLVIRLYVYPEKEMTL